VSVVVSLGVEDDRHERTDVLHSDRLGVEVEDGGGLVDEQGIDVGLRRRLGDVRAGAALVVGLPRRRSGALAGRALQGSAGAGVSLVADLDGVGSLTFGVRRASEGGVVGLFGREGTLQLLQALLLGERLLLLGVEAEASGSKAPVMMDVPQGNRALGQRRPVQGSDAGSNTLGFCGSRIRKVELLIPCKLKYGDSRLID
jgi:hypothetical protein